MVMMILLIAGLLAILVGNLMILVAAFRVHWGWGVACMLLPPAMLAFMVAQWEKAQDGFYYIVFGVGLIIVSAFNFSTVSYDFGAHKRLYYQYYDQTRDLMGLAPTFRSITPHTETTPAAGKNAADINMCVDKSGKVTYTDRPCATGETVSAPQTNQQDNKEKVHSIKMQ